MDNIQWIEKQLKNDNIPRYEWSEIPPFLSDAVKEDYFEEHSDRDSLDITEFYKRCCLWNYIFIKNSVHDEFIKKFGIIHKEV